MSSGHTGVTRPGQTWNKPKDLSVCDREGRVCGEGGGVYTVLSSGIPDSTCGFVVHSLHNCTTS